MVSATVPSGHLNGLLFVPEGFLEIVQNRSASHRVQVRFGKCWFQAFDLPLSVQLTSTAGRPK